MTVNYACARYCLDVIRCLLQGKEIPPMPDGVTMQELFAFAKMHNVEAMVLHGLEQLEPDSSDPVWLNWQNRAAMLLTQSIVQLADRDMLFSALTEAGIRLLPVKGCWIKELYPEIDYRQMSDLDMLIPAEQAQEAETIMRSLGYKRDEYEEEINHTGYFKAPYTEVELHTSLLEEDGGYYDDVWGRAQPDDAYPGLYRFSVEDEYIYYLLHLNKHLEGSGTGIRSILDSAVYRASYPDMDREYLLKEVEKLQLGEALERIETLADCWFGSGVEVPERLQNMAEFILSAGSYGTLEHFSQNQLAQLEKKYKNPLMRGLMYWVVRICRPHKEMARTYPILNKLPILLPFFWVYRALMKVVKRPGDVWNHIKLIFSKGKKHG